MSSEVPSQTHLSRVASGAVGSPAAMFFLLLPFVSVCSYTRIHVILDQCPSSASDSSLHSEIMVPVFTQNVGSSCLQEEYSLGT